MSGKDVDIKRAIDKEQFKKEVQKSMPKSRLMKDCVMAFLVGGLICVVGQGGSKLRKICTAIG